MTATKSCSGGVSGKEKTLGDTAGASCSDNTSCRSASFTAQWVLEISYLPMPMASFVASISELGTSRKARKG